MYNVVRMLTLCVAVLLISEIGALSHVVKRQVDPLLYEFEYNDAVKRYTDHQLGDLGYGPDDDFLSDVSEVGVDKRVLSSFRERMEKEKEQNDYVKWAEQYMRDYEREKELGNIEMDDETNRNFRRYINELWEEYKASRNNRYDSVPKVYRTYDDSMRKRRESEYPSLGWSGVGYRKRETPVNYALADETFYRSMENEMPQRFQVRRRQYPIRNIEIPDDITEPRADSYDDYSYAKKRKRNAVTKRSSNYYMKHYKRFANKDQYHKKYVKKEHASGTDPKIMKDLKTLFDVKDNKTEDEIKKKAILDEKSVKKSEYKTDMKKTVNKEQTATTVVNMSEHEHNHDSDKKKREKETETDNKNRSDDEHLNIKKKSLDWSNYFGYDRRKKSRPSPNDIDEEWLMDRYHNALSSAAKRNTEYPLKYFRNHDDTRKKKQDNEEDRKKKNIDFDNTNEEKLREMDVKLKNIEDLIIDEALKYTGAHEDTTDSKEIQEIKDKVISRLTAAYSLEKMRKALSEFKNSIAAQRNAMKYNEEIDKKSELKNNQVEEKKRDENDEKRSGDNKFQKDKKEDYRSGNELNLDDNQRSILTNSLSGISELEILDRRCRSVAYSVGDQSDFFYPLCKWHQTCYLCTGDASPDALSNCDALFLSKAYSLCQGDLICQWAARPAVEYLRDAFETSAPAGPLDRAVCLATASAGVADPDPYDRFAFKLR